MGVALTAQKTHVTTGAAGAQTLHTRPLLNVVSVGWSIPGRALETGGRMEEDALFSGNKNSTFL